MKHPLPDSLRRLAPPPPDRTLRLIVVTSITAMAVLFAFAGVSHADAPRAGHGGALQILLRADDSNFTFTIDWKE